MRTGGLFSQADILACFLGCGLLLGWQMLAVYPKRKNVITAVQVLMAAVLLATQTRTVIILVTVLSFIWLARHWHKRMMRPLVVSLLIVIGLLAVWSHLAPNRLTDRAYASQSVQYRLTLQHYALRAAAHEPFHGYGPGNLADALPCSQLRDTALQKTCDEGYFFNSSHNIFLDRVLAIGWPGALAFLGLVILALYRNLRGGQARQIWGYTLLLISGYYLTNVTGVTLELLFWVVLFQCLALSREQEEPHA
jgi:O-antigen ligase